MASRQRRALGSLLRHLPPPLEFPRSRATVTQSAPGSYLSLGLAPSVLAIRPPIKEGKLLGWGFPWRCNTVRSCQCRLLPQTELPRKTNWFLTEEVIGAFQMPVSFCSIDWLPIGQDRRQSEESPSIPCSDKLCPHLLRINSCRAAHGIMFKLLAHCSLQALGVENIVLVCRMVVSKS